MQIPKYLCPEKLLKLLLVISLVVLINRFLALGKSSSGEIYNWVDENGVIHITDSPTNREMEKYDVETIASRLRDSIQGFETEEDQEETETDGVGTDLVADIPLNDEDGGAEE